MKIIITTGCTAFDITFDGISESELTPEKREEIVDYLLQKVKEGLRDNTITLERLVEIFQYDNWGNDNEPCGQCGDTVSWTEYNI